MDEPPLDEIGPWSERKLQIIKEYAKAYSQILAKQPKLYHIYIDGFAGAGLHVSRETGEVIKGSPLNVAEIEPPFREYHLVELKNAKVKHLKSLFKDNSRVEIHPGDCNVLLPSKILPRVLYKDFKRAFCLLDPYGLDLDWRVVESAGKLGTVDLLLNFPVMDMNMNVLWHNPKAVSEKQAKRMTKFWGDESWQDASRTTEDTLFGAQDKKAGNEAIVNAYISRLRNVAKFQFLAQPLPMPNTSKAIVYYLVFASQNATAHKIIADVFKKARKPMGV